MIINSYKVTHEILTPEKYLNLTQQEKANIESARIIPAELGSNSFGFIEVSYRFPRYAKEIS